MSTKMISVTSRKITVLVVEDELDLVETLQYNLRQEGYDTRSASTAAEALRQCQRNPMPHLVLLDLMLPDAPGTQVCRELRQAPETRHIPIVMLTARGEEMDRVVGFEMGADDYVVKPFSVRELLLRIRAILNRVGNDAKPAGQPDELGLGPVRIHLAAHRVWVGKHEIQLTALEFKLLTALASRPGRVQTRDQLLEDVWEMPCGVTTRTVDTHIKRLRQKLGNAGQFIETLRGVGYRMVNAQGPN